MYCVQSNIIPDVNWNELQQEQEEVRTQELEKCAQDGVSCEYGICSECHLLNEKGW